MQRFQVSQIIRAAALVVILRSAATARGEWPQWGGPSRDFSVHVGGLRLDWPEEGPRRVWEAALGPGTSSFCIDDMAAYTMYRDGQDEVIVALHAHTGLKLWEYRYAAPIPEGYPPAEELGPRSTPVITGVRIFTLGSLGHVHGLNRTTGQVLWSYDTVKEHKLIPPKTGYAASPILYKDRILFALGSEGAKREAGLFGFHQRSEKGYLWNYHEFEPISAAPMIAPVFGKDQLFVATPAKLVIMDPLNATIRLELPWPSAMTPVWTDTRAALVVPSNHEPGSNVLSFGEDKSVEPKRLWSGTGPLWHQAVVVGNVVVGAGGGVSPKICARGLLTGEELWCDDTFAEAQLLFTGHSLVIIDEKGTVALAGIEPDRLVIRAKTTVEHTGRWSAPAFEDRRLFLRDSKKAIVLELN